MTTDSQTQPRRWRWLAQLGWRWLKTFHDGYQCKLNTSEIAVHLAEGMDGAIPISLLEANTLTTELRTESATIIGFSFAVVDWFTEEERDGRYWGNAKELTIEDTSILKAISKLRVANTCSTRSISNPASKLFFQRVKFEKILYLIALIFACCLKTTRRADPKVEAAKASNFNSRSISISLFQKWCHTCRLGMITGTAICWLPARSQRTREDGVRCWKYFVVQYWK